MHHIFVTRRCALPHVFADVTEVVDVCDMVRYHAKPCDVFGEIMGEILRKVWKSEECVNGAAKNSPHRQLKRSTAASYAITIAIGVIYRLIYI